MKRLAVLGFLIAGPAFAQQAPPDPLVGGYTQLLAEANDRVVRLSVQLNQTNATKATLEARIGELEKQIEALKPKPAAAAPDAK